MRGDAYRRLWNKVREFQPDSLLRAIASVGAARIRNPNRLTQLFGPHLSNPEHALPDFVLSELVKIAIQIEPRPYVRQERVPAARDLAYLQQLYLDVDAETQMQQLEDLEIFMFRLAALQFPSQGGLWQLIPRTLLLHTAFHASDKRDFDVPMRFEEALGLSLADYTFLGVSLFALGMASKDGQLHIEHLQQVKLPVLEPTNISKFLDLVTTDFETFRRECAERCHPIPDLEIYEYNPLVARPVVRLGDGTYVLPIPRLLVERVTSGVYYELAERFGDPFLTYLGHAFQNYIGMLFSDIDGLDLLPEAEYGPKRSRRLSPDWILVNEGGAALLECKSKRLRLGSRLPQLRQQLEQDLRGGISTAVSQLQKSINDIRQKLVYPQLAQARLVPLVATLDHAFLLNGNPVRQIVLSHLRSMGLDPIDYQVASVEELEYLAALGHGGNMLNILFAKSEALDAREYDLATAIRDNGGFQKHPLLERTYREFIAQMGLSGKPNGASG